MKSHELNYLEIRFFKTTIFKACIRVWAVKMGFRRCHANQIMQVGPDASMEVRYEITNASEAAREDQLHTS